MAAQLPDVAFVADSLAVGGAERQLTYMVRALRETGSRVSVLTLARDGGFVDETRARGAEVSSIGPSGTSHLTRLIRLVKAGRSFEPEVVQSAHFHTNLYAAAAGRLLRVPSIGAVRNSLHFSLDRLGRLGRPSVWAPTVVAANSRAAVAEAAALGLDSTRFSVLPNVVDTDEFSPDRVVRDAATFTVCWIGSPKPEKRLDLVVRAFARAFSGEPNAHLLVHGDNRLRREVERESARQRVLGQVEVVATGDPLPTYRRSDALVLASDVEGTPNVVLEAMACGLPVVATAVGDVPELLNGGAGLLARPRHVDGIAQALVRLRREPQARLEMGRKARRQVEAGRSLSRLTADLACLYDRAGVRVRGQPRGRRR